MSESTFYSRIRDVQENTDAACPIDDYKLAYSRGHRDALSAASHIGASADFRIERLEKALRDLVKVNEDWNANVQSIIGRPVNWNDSYLDAARAALSHEN